MNASFGLLQYFFWLLLIVAFVMEAFALIDALLGVATALGLAHAAAPLGGASPIGLLLGILPVAAFIAAAIYLTDVRPAVRPYKGGNRGSSGPYGPW